METLLAMVLALAQDAEWLTSHEQALEKARETGKPLLLLSYDTL